MQSCKYYTLQIKRTVRKTIYETPGSAIVNTRTTGGLISCPNRAKCYLLAKISRIRLAASEGVLPTFTPAASRASFFA